MARRILDTAFWDDTDVAKLGYPERLLLICMITDEALSNDYGWLPAHPALLRKHAFAYDECTVSEVEAWRDHILETCKNVKLYSVNGQDYIDLVKFPEWQRLRYQRKTHLPPPPWYEEGAPNNTIPEDSHNSGGTSSKEAQKSEKVPTTVTDPPLGRVVLSSVEKGRGGKGDTNDKRSRVSSGKNAVRKALEKYFIAKTKLPRPQMNTAKQKKAAGERWWQPLRRIAELVDQDLVHGTKLIDAALERLEGLTVSAPQSILKTVEAIVGEQARGGAPPRSVVDEWVGKDG